MRRKSRDTEVDAYIFIKENLKALGWDTRNPERSEGGQVYTQNECLSNPEISKLLGLERPENLVRINDEILWVIEAKRSHAELDKAIREGEDYADKLNRGRAFKAKFVSGVAGNSTDSFLIKSFYRPNGHYSPIVMNGVETSGLLSPDLCRIILETNKPEIADPPIDEKLFLDRATVINEILHLGAINPHQRASVMAALLLSMLSDTGPNIQERRPDILISDINTRVLSVLRDQDKAEFAPYMNIPLPTTKDNHIKFRQALVDTVQELRNLNIRSAMNSGADWLGAFYEVFLKYANWAQDLGIVLTPRHATRYAAEVMDIQVNDIVFDPTCGTGGFLVAAFDNVKQKANDRQLAKFKKYSVFGVEQDAGIAALAVVNMIFRGDGKNNIIEGNCFAKFLELTVEGGITSARYVSTPSDQPPVTKTLMNPPFSLKRSIEKEYRFVDQALAQMQDGGLLFAILPYPAMAKRGGYLNWRKNFLLPRHTLLAVVTLPVDLFYPVGVTTVGVFIRKGVPHNKQRNVMWVRALTDGLLKSKGKRLPSNRTTNDLERVKNDLRAFIHNPNHSVPNVDQFTKADAIDFDDNKLELVPEVYLDQAHPDKELLAENIEHGVRDLFSYLIKINKATLRPEFLQSGEAVVLGNPNWKSFNITDIFQLKRGSFHSIAKLDPGQYPTISRSSTDNGLVGFYERPEKVITKIVNKVVKKTVIKATLWKPGTISVSTVTGDAFIQPVPFLATDNVVLLLPRPNYEKARLTTLLFMTVMINDVKWRYSYGRQCYQSKFATTNIMLPVKSGILDEDFMQRAVEGAFYWKFVKAAFLNEQFTELADEWREDTAMLSVAKKKSDHPAYRKIIAMGEPVLPFIFRELKNRREHWLHALQEITGKDAAKANHNFKEAVAAWLEWGKEKGYA
jgi:type I restriction enzyme M protein